MITLYRFSNDGFSPKYQEHLYFDYHKSLSDMNLDGLTDYMISLIERNLSIPKDPNFCFHGVFAFLIKPTHAEYRHYLNHLDKAELPDFNNDFYSQSFPSDATCYIDDGFCYHLHNKTTLKEAFYNNNKAIYLPFY